MNDQNIMRHLPAVDPTIKVEQIIVARINMKPVGNSPAGLEFFYDSISMPIAGSDIGKVISDILNGVAALVPSGRDAPSPLDLKCTRPSYIVFHLNPDWNWRFSDKDPAITTKKDCGDRYSALIHVGADASQSRTPIADAKLIYFAANVPPPEYHDGINIHVDLPQKAVDDSGVRKVMRLILDPDIKNPGGEEG